MKTLIKGGTIVNEGRVFNGDIVVEDGTMIEIGKQQPEASFDETIDASGCYVLPGVIDDHVHFREPGLTAKADIDSESRAAAAGGVTSYFDMPNCNPQTTTLEALQEKQALAAKKSHVNYAFFFGATNDNADLFSQLDATRIPGIKLFMGSSTGNMLVDRQEALERIFKTCKLPLMVHCEDTDIINRNMANAQEAWGEDPPVSLHAMIRSEEACLESTRKAVALANKYGTRLHVAHISTAEELECLPPAPSKKRGDSERCSAPSPFGEGWGEASLESDLELYFPDQYVPSDSERMLLYRELDGLQTDEQVAAYRTRLIDRFGPVPHCGEELMRVVPLRRLGQLFGCEKIVLKQQRMTLFFVTQNDSPFYQSEAFGMLLDYVAHNPRRCNFREVNGKRSMVITDVPTIEEAVQILSSINKSN